MSITEGKERSNQKEITELKPNIIPAPQSNLTKLNKQQMNIIKYNHHGKEVSVIEHLKGTHKEHCLCYQNCTLFKPNTENNCKIAEANFELCKTHGVVTPIFECPKYNS